MSARRSSRDTCIWEKPIRDDLGRRAPLIGLLPLRIARALRQRRRKS